MSVSIKSPHRDHGELRMRAFEQRGDSGSRAAVVCNLQDVDWRELRGNQTLGFLLRIALQQGRSVAITYLQHHRFVVAATDITDGIRRRR